MIHDMSPGTGRRTCQRHDSAYIGYDPTSDSLILVNLASIMMLVHFQKAGHKHFALVGGADGNDWRPSGKSEERNLLDENTLRYKPRTVFRNNSKKFLDFSTGSNSARNGHNMTATQGLLFPAFPPRCRQHITVNYMLAKDSVKNPHEFGFGDFFY